PDFVVATVAAGLAALLIGGAAGLAALLLVWACAHLLARWWTRDLGGLTGDTYGALCEICEVVVLATLAAARG
ncbi:MAG: adenosylcobinamide-GDP ribazoletransferase, partial [Chloroflexales bacterium]|nr:adenosylcobinamide-GDP ribazoletransferase [Chloroflexales bacterium]